MKLASGEGIVWLIIAIAVAISKGLGKLKAPSQPPEADDDDAPPLPPPSLQQPRRAVAPVPIRRPQQRSVPPLVRPGIDDVQRQAPPRDFRELLAQLTKPAAPQPAPIPPKAVPVPAPRKAPPKAAEEPKVIPPPKTAPGTARNTQWTEALRDRSNVRNIIIAAEIIGPPRGA